jgi:predicted RNA binding protein YcfA (HicA-like mRNA interferase family)
MHHISDTTKQPLTIPRHKTLGTGLLRKLIRDAQITTEELIELL